MLLPLLAPLAAGGLLALLGAELAARSWFRRTGLYEVHEAGSRLHMELDPRVHADLSRVVRFEVNRLGQRGAEPPSGDEVFRVLTVGGSAVECYFLDQPESWPGQLEERLNRPEALAQLGRGRAYVANVGRSLCSAAMLDLILSRTLPQYGPQDAILVMVGASDVLAWLSSGATKIQDSPRPDMSFEWHPETRFGFHPKKAALTELARRVTRRGSTTRRSDVGKWLVRARALRLGSTDWRDETPDTSAMVANFERYFRAVLQQVQRAAPHVLVVRQPWFEKAEFTEEERQLLWNGGIGNAVSGDIKAFYTDRVLFEALRDLDQACARVSAEMGVPSLDLMPILPRSASIYYDHFHHTPRGAALIADHVAESVIATASPAARVPSPADG